MSERQALAMPSFDEMDDFAPRSGAGQGGHRAGAGRVHDPEPAGGQGRAQGAARPVPPAVGTRRAIDAVSQFPSREASADAQMNLKGPRSVLDRFRRMCREDRRAYYDMLEILMDSFESRNAAGK